MSSALVRQALEIVDPEESVRGRNKKAKRPKQGQEHSHPYKNKSKKPEKPEKSAEEIAEENIRKLLALSKPTADPSITKKIVQRAVGGKPLVDKPVKKKEENKSILFADEDAS